MTHVVERPQLPRIALLSLVVLGFTIGACGGTEMPLADTHDTPRAVIEAALSALQTEDSEGLRALLVSRDEFEQYMWPVMPDRENTRLDFFWGMMAANTRKGVRQLEHTYGGVPMEVVSISMPEEEDVERYEAFAFHTGVKVVVRRLDTGEEGLLPSFDGLLEYEGRWKLLNYDEL